jgi:phosphomannomutase
MQARLRELIDAGDEVVLRDHVGADLAFGTAGLRGEVGPGPNRMNRAVVIRASRGLADWALANVPDARTRGVVVGYDARPDSPQFARDTAAVMAAAGLRVALFDRPAPTPLAAFAMRVRNAATGVVVTASHNPPADNGYKVYDPTAIQITAPTDAEIAAAIAAVGPAREVPGVGKAPFDLGVESIGGEIVDEYLAAIAGERPDHGDVDRSVPIVLTSLHGVGGELAMRALREAGFTAVHAVPEQADPDGAFPTVAFPNPEEPGALDLALALATEVGAHVVLANDPDADRLAVAIPDGDGWRRLHGDEVGVLLADHLLEHHGAGGLVASSIVSTARLDAVAEHHGARRLTTLTGFKWIWRALRDVAEADGLTPVLGYEEALGYSVGTAVRDKDGISAAVVVADLVAGLRAQGLTLTDRLIELDERYGRWAHGQRSLRRDGPEGDAAIAVMMVRAEIPPTAGVAGRQIERVENLRTGAGARPAWLPADLVLIWHLTGGGRILIRPSGTEPKLKIYADLPIADADRRRALAEVLTATADHLTT